MAKPKKPAPPKTPPVATDAPMRTLDDIDASRGPARVKALRDKFAKALDDPDMREAMARYLQTLIREEK
ncbi:MAG: hypothetical protein JNK21_02610 [Rhodospirillaceae bacterium]|nr:hypothetical protein [Rhodospirillaceae bacterium]